jgi:hypothetical protein
MEAYNDLTSSCRLLQETYESHPVRGAVYSADGSRFNEITQIEVEPHTRYSRDSSASRAYHAHERRSGIVCMLSPIWIAVTA